MTFLTIAGEGLHSLPTLAKLTLYRLFAIRVSCAVFLYMLIYNLSLRLCGCDDQAGHTG